MVRHCERVPAQWSSSHHRRLVAEGARLSQTGVSNANTQAQPDIKTAALTAYGFRFFDNKTKTGLPAWMWVRSGI